MAKGQDQNERYLALIKCARSLDQDTTQSLNEKIDSLLLLTAAAKSGSFHAAEEIGLRWLLKQMGGSTDVAEQVRRYPFSWTILGFLFDRIPLFSLSRIFIERRFLSVLQQAAKDIAKPSKQQHDLDATVDGSKVNNSKKRKREDDSATTFDLEKLRTSELCVRSAGALFGALAKLLSLLDAAPSQHAEEVTIGAEHVKSLFRVPAEELRELVAPLLSICRLVPDVLRVDLASEHLKWIHISTYLWDLRAASKGDADEFAKFLFPICCTLIYKIKGLGLDKQTRLVHPVARRWLWEASALVMKNLVNPAQATFFNPNDGGLNVFTIALATAGKNFAICAEVLWHLAVGTQQSDDPVAKKEFTLWTQAVFAFLLKALEEAGAADKAIISGMLDTAIWSKSSVESATTRRICTEYALKDGTDWALVAKIVQCEPDLFVMDSELRTTVLARAKTVSLGDLPDSDVVATETLVPLMRAFSKLRDLSGFVQTWYKELAEMEAESKDALAKTVWADSRLRDEFAQIMQSSLSTMQVLNLIDWLSSQDGGPGSLLIMMDALAAAISQWDYAVAVGSKLVDIISKKRAGRDFFSDIRGLMFRIVGRTITWLKSDDVHQIWTETGSEIKRIIGKGSFATLDTYEAFKCICKFCSHMGYTGSDEVETMKVGCAFVARLSTEIGDQSDLSAFPNFLDYAEVALSSFPNLEESPHYKSKGLQSDLAQLLLALRRLIRAGVSETPRITAILRNFLVDQHKSERPALHLFLDEIVRDMCESNDVCPWTKDAVKTDLSLLSMFHMDYLFKERRKSLMTSWARWSTQVAQHCSSSAEYAKLVMGVLLLVSRQPTFYSNMKFDDIVELGLGLSSQSAQVLVSLEGLVQYTVGYVIDNAGPTAEAYIAGISAYARNLDVSETDNRRVHLVLLQSAMIALKHRSQSKSILTFNVDVLVQKQRSITEQSLTQLASGLKKMDDKGEQSKLAELDLILDASETIKEDITTQPIELSSKTLKRLSEASQKLCAAGNSTGWKLRTFLTSNQNIAMDIRELIKEQNSADAELGDDEESIFAFVDAATDGFDTAKKLELLHRLIGDHDMWKDSSTACLVVRRIVATIPSSAKSISSNASSFDLATVHNSLALCLTKTTSPKVFGNIVKTMVDLLTKHAAAISQSNIDFTLSSVARICSAEGPKLEKGAHVTSEVFVDLYGLVSTIIVHHRTRLRGHYHLLITTLQVLLRVLLADPVLRFASSRQQLDNHSNNNATTSFLHPPWLYEPLRAHHATNFTRLLTLLCEPSNAALASSSTSKHKSALDSAKDTAKREVGQHVFRVVLLYIKLQLERGDVRRDVRRALEPGMFSVLSVTPDGGRRILNESMDTSGRVIFRRMFAEFTKSAKRNNV
ncbi:Urb2/Npa2 family protein [Apiospora kogelbergensis]|uniref:Urb2/Npa2 family protein n=1 Tax=Apiospora kogelbergensis TaxID=1337665 RepID=A0AAW0R321_9PEZI